jgi:hypothetical protein
MLCHASWTRLLLAALVGLAAGDRLKGGESAGPNQFLNPSFDLGREGWHMETAAGTSARFTVENCDCPAGPNAARITVGAVRGWGVQFGQHLEAPPPGQAWTFSVLARAVGKPVRVRLEIERAGQPYDRAAATGATAVPADRWTELRLSFRVEKAFPEGWFAYVSCEQPESDFRVDMFRLEQGEYVPYAEAAKRRTEDAGVSLFDTMSVHGDCPNFRGRCSVALETAVIAAKMGLSPSAPGQTPLPPRGWKQLGEDHSGHVFQGDAVMRNDRLALVVGRGARGARLFAQGNGRCGYRAQLAPVAGGGSATVRSIRVLENSPSLAALEVGFTAATGPVSLRFLLGMGQPFVRVESNEDGRWLAVEAPCRFVVLPDFFADDIVVDAAEIPVAEAELPSENFLLHLLPGGESMVFAVAAAREQEARVRLAGAGEARRVSQSAIGFGGQRKIWVAVLEGKGIWHRHDVGAGEAGRVCRLGWTVPFAAQWRMDWRLADRLTSSWEMIVQRGDGQFAKYGMFGEPGTIPENRHRWTTVLGSFSYPCWIDRSGQGFLEPLGRAGFQGPALAYPLNRTPRTPLAVYTLVDLVRATLGVGPCEYVLDIEGQGATMKGRATCATRDLLKEIYAAGRQRERRAEIEDALVQVVAFVKHIRSRIEQYRAFSGELLDYLGRQKAAQPALAGFLAEMETLTRAIPAAYDRRREDIRTPQYVVALTEKFRATVLARQGPDALAKCNAITNAIVVVGGNQDELVGESRQAARILRQRAGLAMALDPRTAGVAKEIRARCQKVLRNACSYEAPQH